MSSNFPSNGEPEVLPGEVVSRESNETYTLEAWVVGAEAIDESRVYTYGRTDGYYLLSPEDNADLVEALDDVFEEMFEAYGAVDEDALSRTPGDGYEVTVAIDEREGDVPYDSRFGFSRATVHLSPDFDAELVEAVDEVFDAIREQVADE